MRPVTFSAADGPSNSARPSTKVGDHVVGYSPKSVCLRFIDPYGDATFNQLQLPLLLRELKDAIQS